MTTLNRPKPKRVEVYGRLPEIYKIKDQDLPNLYRQSTESVPADQLRRYLEAVEEMFSAIHENIELSSVSSPSCQ